MLIFLSLFACSPCKQLCDDMADYAENTCGYTVTDNMMEECKTAQGEKTREDRQDCRQVQSHLEEEWDCAELDIYFRSTATSESSSAQ